MGYVVPIEVSDPRPVLHGRTVLGARCETCGHASAWQVERCERCRGVCRPVAHGPEGVVWSSATVRLPVGDRTPPFTLAYVDLAGSDGLTGPRVLARIGLGSELAPGTAVAVTGSDAGDILVDAVHAVDDCAGGRDAGT